MTLSNINKRQVLIAISAAIVIAALGYVATRMGPLAPTQVTVIQVKSENLTPSVFGIGSVEARQSWLMGPTVAGRVLRVHVDAGQAVKAGDLGSVICAIGADSALNPGGDAFVDFVAVLFGVGLGWLHSFVTSI